MLDHLEGIQSAGDYLLVSVPNQEKEPIQNILFFLPHIHSFTPRSLASLVTRHGYGLQDASLTTPQEINMIFRRGIESITEAPSCQCPELPKDVSFNKTVKLYVK